NYSANQDSYRTRNQYNYYNGRYSDCQSSPPSVEKSYNNIKSNRSSGNRSRNIPPQNNWDDDDDDWF
ncbi:MAG: hypothetical protein ACKPI8_01270, partial [Microcystis panniformis]